MCREKTQTEPLSSQSWTLKLRFPIGRSAFPFFIYANTRQRGEGSKITAKFRKGPPSSPIGQDCIGPFK